MKHDAFTSGHAAGFDRFTRIIDANPNYHTIVNRRQPKPELEYFDSDAPLSEKIERAIEVCRQSLLKGPLRLIHPTTEVAYYGSTANNLREFRFFSEICEVPFQNDLDNYAKCEKIKAPILEEAQDLISSMMKDIRPYYEGRSNISRPLVQQQILYSRSYLGFTMSFRDASAVRPKLFIVANDHSPVPVAVSMVMKDLGVPRVYVQHAEISPTFPPLDFEVSILRNAASLELYRQIGPVAGNVFVVARGNNPPRSESLSRRREAPVRVVIYPTARVIPGALNTLIATLNGNPGIKHVAIKPHPGSSPPLDKVVTEPVEMISDIPDDDHIAIVGNSSIAVELLRAGIPVYQNFSFDPVLSDYYGFVSRGLTIEAPSQRLSAAFWVPYDLDEAWWDAYRRLDPGGMPDQELIRSRLRAKISSYGIKHVRMPESMPGASPENSVLAYLKRKAKKKQKKFGRRIESLLARLGLAERLLKSRGKAGAGKTAKGDIAPSQEADLASARLTGPQRYLLWQALREANDLPAWLEQNARTASFAERSLIELFEERFAVRDPDLLAIFGGRDWFPVRSAVGAWMAMKRAEWNKEPLTESALDAIFHYICEADLALSVRKKLESMLITRALATGSISQVYRFAQSNNQDGRWRLSLAQQINLLRRLSTNGEPEEYARVRALFSETWAPIDALKVRNSEALDGRAAEDWTHERAAILFRDAVRPEISEELEALVLPAYGSNDVQPEFFDVRSNARQRAELLVRIRDALVSRSPFSLLRLSDREGYLFARPGYFFTAEDVANCELHWWGCRLEPDMRDRLIDMALPAVATADVVGVPSIFRFIRDFNPNRSSLLETLQGRGLLEVLAHFRQHLGRGAVITEDKVNVALFSDPQDVVDLAQFAESVVIVGSVKPEFIPEALTALSGLRFVQIPTHMRTGANAAFHSSDVALPFVADDIDRQIAEAAGPGVIFLVSAGIAGKRFMHTARQHGAVAIDLGNVLDDWLTGGLGTLR
ncbi:MAG: hypothetical protein NXH83_03655 [Rhodobacteraceae bacterium]|nr:hypothetical protein [Paracoccaceae bacterium]